MFAHQFVLFDQSRNFLLIVRMFHLLDGLQILDYITQAVRHFFGTFTFQMLFCCCQTLRYILQDEINTYKQTVSSLIEQIFVKINKFCIK